MFCSKILVKNNRNAFASPFLKFAQSFEACKLNFFESEVKNWFGRSAVGSIWDRLSKLHQELLLPADGLLNPFGIFQKNAKKMKICQTFWGVFETSNALAVYCELFQLIIFKRFLILSKSTLSGFIVRTLYIMSPFL